MKFAEHLSAHITPEWRKQYINYEVSMNFIIYITLNNSFSFQRFAKNVPQVCLCEIYQTEQQQQQQRINKFCLHTYYCHANKIY